MKQSLGEHGRKRAFLFRGATKRRPGSPFLPASSANLFLVGTIDAEPTTPTRYGALTQLSMCLLMARITTKNTVAFFFRLTL